MKLDISDIFICAGLLLIGIGIYLWFGAGPALSIDGAIVLILGTAWNVAGSGIRKR